MADEDAQRGPSTRLRRRAVPIVAALTLGVFVAILWSLPSERLDVGSRRIFSVIAAAVAGGVTCVWFIGLSGAAKGIRFLAACALFVLVVGAIGSVRRVEFSGDMVPTFDFRWQRTRESILEDYLASEQRDPQPIEGDSAGPQVPHRVQSEDSPQYRGRNRDGIVEGPALARDWNARPPPCLWRHPCGGGYAGFAVVGNKAVTIEQRGKDEVIVCYDVLSGRHHWTYAYAALFSERLGGDGPRATPAIYQGRVYSLGAVGDLVKLDLAAGYLIWRKNILAENGSGNLEWAMSGSPLVYDDRVVVNPGSQLGTDDSADLLVFDADHGDILVRGGRAKASYASPVLVTLQGKAQFLIFDAVGLASFDPETGAELWRYGWTSDFDINAAQPVVLDDARVVISSASGCALLEINLEHEQWAVREVWRNRVMKCGYANPIAHGGYLYGLDESALACLDLATGRRMWKQGQGRYGHGQMLLSGDLLVVLGEHGELALVEAVPDAFHELGRIQAIDGKTWNNPVLVDGRVLVRNHLEMACYDLPLVEPRKPAEQPLDESDADEMPEDRAEERPGDYRPADEGSDDSPSDKGDRSPDKGQPQ